MLQHLEEIIKMYEPQQQITLRHYAIKMNERARIYDYAGYMMFGTIFTSLCQTYYAQNALKKIL